MSEKEIAMQLINNLPDYKLGYVIAYLQGLTADESADDNFCISLIKNYENSEDKGSFISFDDAVKMCGVDPNEIQNEIDKRAVKFIAKQPKPQRERLLKAIYKLPESGDIKQMHGYAGYYRLRVGDYRIIYTADNNVLLVRVIEIGNRGDIYK